MNVVGKVGNLISQGVYTVATPFHPFGGAVDIIVVQQQDGSFRTTPWYVRFGKFQGVLKRSEKLVRINVNGVEANFHMYLDNSGEAYFSREADPGETSDGAVKKSSSDVSKENGDNFDEGFESNRLQSTISDPGMASDVLYSMRAERLERSESDVCHFYDFQDDQSDGSIEFSSEYGSNRFENLEAMDNFIEPPGSDSEVVLVSIDGHILTAPISSFKEGNNTVLNTSENTWASGFQNDAQSSSSKTSDSGSSIEQPTEDCKDKEDAYQDNEQPARELDAGFLDKDQDNRDSYQLDVSEVGGENESQNQVIDDVVNQESDFDAHKSFESKVENGDGEMQSENSLVDIREEANSAVQVMQSENFSVDIHEEAEEQPIQNLLECDTPITQTSLEVEEVRCEDEVRIENGSASSFSNSTTGIPNGEIQPSEEISTGVEVVIANSSSDGNISDNVDKHLTISHSLEATQSSPDRDSTEAEISIHEVEALSKNLTASETVSDDTDSDNSDSHLNASNSHEALQSIPNGDASETERHEHEVDPRNVSPAGLQESPDLRVEISLCRHLLHPGMGSGPAAETFDAHRISAEEFKLSSTSIIKDENLVVRLGETYLPWDKAAHIVLGMAVFDLDLPVETKDAIPVEQKAIEKLKDDNEAEGVSTPRRRWRLWPMSFRRSKTLEPSISNVSSDDIFLDPEASHSPSRETTPTSLSQASNLSAGNKSPHKKYVRTNIPTSEQIASLNLKDGQNLVTFSFCTRVWGMQQVEAHIYLWKYNARIVISDVDGTITKSDVLGQFMPLVGRDWSQSGVAKLFSAIKENGYQLLFLSARAIVQAYLTKSFLVNLKQDGKTLPDGPVVISPDGLFPSLFREVIRRAPHEFKIACLQDIKALFPADYNPFYAGFGNRDTDELSYRKIGIPKGKIFIINPKGEVAISHRIDVKSYTSLHTLVNDMFPPTSMVEQEDYNHWNYWKMPIPDVEDL